MREHETYNDLENDEIYDDGYYDDGYYDDEYFDDDYIDPYEIDPEEENRSRKGRRNRKNSRKFSLFNLIPVILGILIIGSSALLFRDLWRYHVAKSEYKSLEEYIAVSDVEKETATPVTEDGGEIERAAFEIPALDINYDALESINSDFAGVLYIPTLSLRYPMVYSSDNEEYLTRTFEGTNNPSGSIFVDKNALRDYTDYNTIIYGHNMKNETMFGSLKRFSQDDTLVEEHPYFYIYTSDYIYQYRIFAYYTVSNIDDMYDGVHSAEEYISYVDTTRNRSFYTPDDLEIDFANEPNLVTLSTCWGTGHEYNFVVVGALTDRRVNAR